MRRRRRNYCPAVPSIGFLHTSAVHVPTFNSLVAAAGDGTATACVVDESLLALARLLGPGHVDVGAGVAAGLGQLRDAGADIVVCTCSTIGGEAERIGAIEGLRVLRVDRPMAEAAVAAGPQIAVVAALESTLAPTGDLLASVADFAMAPVEIVDHVVEVAWDLFEAGDLDGYLAAIAETMMMLDGTCDVIVLAQASMSGAADRVRLSVPVLSSPALAVDAAIAAIAEQRAVEATEVPCELQSTRIAAEWLGGLRTTKGEGLLPG